MSIAPDPKILKDDITIVPLRLNALLRQIIAALNAGGGGGGGGKFTYDSVAPASPAVGDRWGDSTSGILYVWIDDASSTQWVEF